MGIYFTPTAIGYLTQLILGVLISGYLLWRVRHSNVPVHIRLLTGFFVLFTLFVGSLFV